MPRPALLTDSEIADALAALPGWERAGDEIVRTFECASFPDAIAFVVRIGFFAERADHHPDLDIRWRKVRVALTTHDAGGLTALDLELARATTGAFTAPKKD
jgi:4a-hydroxytetrahydrobiopterin dehydratase